MLYSDLACVGRLLYNMSSLADSGDVASHTLGQILEFQWLGQYAEGQQGSVELVAPVLGVDDKVGALKPHADQVHHIESHVELPSLCSDVGCITGSLTDAGEADRLQERFHLGEVEFELDPAGILEDDLLLVELQPIERDVALALLEVPSQLPQVLLQQWKEPIRLSFDLHLMYFYKERSIQFKIQALKITIKLFNEPINAIKVKGLRGY